MSETILMERKGSVVYLTLNRPEVLNAINRELGNTLLGHLKDCEEDDTVRAIVLRGSGRAFCAGDDIRGGGQQRGDGSQPSRDPVRTAREGPYYNLVKAIRTIPKPVIARVHGYAVGAGCDLVLASDFAIAAESARIGLVFVQRAIIGGTYLITKHIGLKRASELLLLGDWVEAPKAMELGMITRCVPDDELDSTLDEWVERIAKGPTKVMGYIKTGINLGLNADVERGVEHQSYMQYFATLTEDRAEGAKAFVEKRQPVYTGR